MNKKGFTLIELLVVIAIIGILSSIAIVYLGDARNKANDAKVISNVATVSTQIEVNRAGNETIDAASIDAMITKLGTHPCSGTSYTYTHTADFSKVAVMAPLCLNAAQIWCADSDSFRGLSSGSTANSGVCNAPAAP